MVVKILISSMRNYVLQNHSSYLQLWHTAAIN